MIKILENLSKQELIELIKNQNQALVDLKKDHEQIQVENQKVTAQSNGLSEKCQYLELRVAQLTRMLFGQKRERFENPDQPELPFTLSAVEQQLVQQQVEEKISYFHFKYAAKDHSSVSIGHLPERVIDKGIPGAGLLATILTEKYIDHLPLYRQKMRFAREQIKIASSTLEGWVKEALRLLEPLYDKLVLETKSKGYLQVDETTIKVLESERKGACHQGYYWCYHAPLDGIVLFDYSPTRGIAAPYPMLKDFKGYLQTDGYSVYEHFAKSKDITAVACWAHARREFERALENDKERAEIALAMIGHLYQIEQKAREESLTATQIKELRLSQSLPVLNALGKWLATDIQKVLPKSQIGKAMAYTLKRWEQLMAYLYDGHLHIDNNLVENVIRPVALGRKNYLFAGSHEAAQRAAMIYSFFAICKKHDVNPYAWLKHTLQNINTTPYKNLTNLYPQNYKQSLAD